MIIEEKVKDLVVIGEDTSKKATISGNKLAKLQYLLTKGLYKDPITAVIAEWTNNGIDAVVQAGKNPIETPVIVSIGETPESKGQLMFRVEDKGTGLDDRDFEDICMNYLESTKESDNDTIGHFGIGMKSFLSLERPATFICRKNGVERKYLVYEGAEFVNYDLIHEKQTTEENGVIAEIRINDWYEKRNFVEKSLAKLAYYDTVVVIIDNKPIDNTIYRNEIFQWSTMNKCSTVHLCLKDVFYEIDWTALGIPSIDIPVAIRLNLSDGITPTPSRESYITNQKTKELILKKIEELAEWLVKKYNDTVKNFKSFMEAYDYLGETEYYVNLKDDKISFRINNILKYSKTKIANIKVDGITVRDPNFYKTRRMDLLRGYTPAGYVTYNNVMRSKINRIGVGKEGHVLDKQGVTVLVTDNFRGNIKDYLKEKYGTETLFLRNNGFVRRIGKAKEYHPNGQVKIDYETFRHILQLSYVKRENWRSNIEEWNFVVSSIASTFKDETKVETDTDFHKWLEQKRQAQKDARKLNGNKAYNGLDKQEGDVTLAYTYERYGRAHFAKKAYPIANLTKNKFLTVLVTDADNVDLIKEVSLYIKDKHNIRFAHVGKKEIKKIPKHFQFINFQQFMSRDCKPFMRIASCIKFSEILEDYAQLKNHKNIVFKEIFKTFNSDADKLKRYVDKHIMMHYSLSDQIKNIIIDVADEHKLYDLELWAEYLRLKENVQKYDFINLLEVPSTTNHELTKRYERLVNQMLLFRKKFYNDLPEGARIVFDQPEVKTKENEVV